VTEKKGRDVEGLLSEEILADARRKAERTVARAQMEADRVVEQAVKSAEAVRESVLARAGTLIERERRVFDSSLRLEERMLRLKTEGGLLDEAFSRAVERLGKRDGFNDYRRLVRDLAVEAVSALTGDAFVLHLAKPDLESMRSTLPGEVAKAVRDKSGREVQLVVAGKPAAIDTGVIVTSADGARRVDNSLAARLTRARRELRFAVANVLFDESDAAAASGETRQ
jgi:vacuolar-type H+-ATPase subunit E/Vma4